MAKLVSNFWVIESFRPGMRLIDYQTNKTFKELKEAYENDSIEDHPKAKKYIHKQYAAECFEYSEKDKEAAVVITADEFGRFTTDDPVLARRIVDMLEAAVEINHPLTKKPVKFELDRTSPPVPTKAELEKAASKK